MSQPKIFTMRFDEAEGKQFVRVELGDSSASEFIPAGEGVVRVSAVLQGEKITGLELVTKPLD